MYTHIMKLTALPLIFAGLSLTGCASVTRVPLQKATRASIQSTNGVLLTSYNTILPEANIKESDGDNGFLGMLIINSINAHRINKAVNAAYPIQHALEGYNFNPVFSEQIRKNLMKIKWLKLKDVNVRFNPNQNLPEDMISYKNHHSALMTSFQYDLSTDGKTVGVSTDAKLYVKNDGNNLKYQNSFIFLNKLNNHTLSKKEAILYWSRNKASKVRNTLKLAAKTLAIMISNDIKDAKVEPTVNKVLPRVVFKNTMGMKIKGYLVKSGKYRSMVRTSNGWLYSVSNNMLSS